MKTILGFFAAVILVAGLSAFATLQWTARRPRLATADSHRWLHEQLNLTPEQHAALAPIEARYAEQQRRALAELHAANRDLAKAMADGKALTPQVAAAVERIHHHQGELQKISIAHVFEMRQVLSAEQGDRLLELARQALESAP